MTQSSDYRVMTATKKGAEKKLNTLWQSFNPLAITDERPTVLP